MKTHLSAVLLDKILTDPSVKEAIFRIGEDGEEAYEGLCELKAILANAPNFELKSLLFNKRPNEMASTLKGLVSLSKYDKQRWVSIIEDFNLPIELNRRASSRDIVGKVLAYLDEHPEALQSNRSIKTKSDSASLEDTLNKLINFR